VTLAHVAGLPVEEALLTVPLAGAVAVLGLAWCERLIGPAQRRGRAARR
jgi:hypothetical protein